MVRPPATGVGIDDGDFVGQRRIIQGERHAIIMGADVERILDVEFRGLSKDEFRFLIDAIDRLIECGDRAVALQTYILSGLTAGDER